MGTQFKITYGSENPEKVYDVYKELMKHAQKHPLYIHLADKDKIFMVLTSMNRAGQLAYFYYKDKLVGVVAFSIEPDCLWWGHGTAVRELFVLSMSSSVGFGRVAAQFLKDLCKENKCDFILAGAFLGTNNSYRKVGGYSTEYPSFICLRKDCL